MEKESPRFTTRKRIEDGYNADIETWSSDEETASSDEGEMTHLRKRIRAQDRQIHRRHTNRQSPPTPPPFFTSQIVLSKFLIQYWDATHPHDAVINKPVGNMDSTRQAIACPTRLKTRKTLPKVEVSERFFSLEKSLSFSELARILLEAEPPYRVVHANAAYARLREGRRPIVVSDDEQNTSSLQAAASYYFDCQMMDNAVVRMYPVTGSDYLDRGDAPRTATHYLVEATSTHPLAQPMNEYAHVVG